MDQQGDVVDVYNLTHDGMVFYPSDKPLKYDPQATTTPKSYQESYDGNTYFNASLQDWQADGFSSPISTSIGLECISTPQYIQHTPIPTIYLPEQPTQHFFQVQNITYNLDWNDVVSPEQWKKERWNTLALSTTLMSTAKPQHASNNPYPPHILTPTVPSILQVKPSTTYRATGLDFEGARRMQTKPKIEDGDHNKDEDEHEHLISDGANHHMECTDGGKTDKTTTMNQSKRPGEEVHESSTYNNDLFCSICSQKIARPEHLKRHVKSVHPLDPSSGFKCKFPKCNKRLKRKDSVLPHYLTHVTSQHAKRRGKNNKVELVEFEKIVGSMDEIEHFHTRLNELHQKRAQS
jgi:hypothetical protein